MSFSNDRAILFLSIRQGIHIRLRKFFTTGSYQLSYSLSRAHYQFNRCTRQRRRSAAAGKGSTGKEWAGDAGASGVIHDSI
jgi:hypothetical protein